MRSWRSRRNILIYFTIAGLHSGFNAADEHLIHGWSATGADRPDGLPVTTWNSGTEARMNRSKRSNVASSRPGWQEAKYAIYAHLSNSPFSTIVLAIDHIRTPCS